MAGWQRAGLCPLPLLTAKPCFSDPTDHEAPPPPSVQPPVATLRGQTEASESPCKLYSALAHTSQGSLWKTRPQWVLARLGARWARPGGLAFPLPPPVLQGQEEGKLGCSACSACPHSVQVTSLHVPECFPKAPTARTVKTQRKINRSRNTKYTPGFRGWGFSLEEEEV